VAMAMISDMSMTLLRCPIRIVVVGMQMNCVRSKLMQVVRINLT
jgi:hypothetical protein